MQCLLLSSVVCTICRLTYDVAIISQSSLNFTRKLLFLSMKLKFLFVHHLIFINSAVVKMNVIVHNCLCIRCPSTNNKTVFRFKFGKKLTDKLFIDNFLDGFLSRHLRTTHKGIEKVMRFMLKENMKQNIEISRCPRALVTVGLCKRSHLIPS